VTEQATVTNIIASINRWLDDRHPSVVVSISQSFPIDPTGSWVGSVYGSGIRAEVKGQLDGDTAEGTLRVGLATSTACAPEWVSSGTVCWRARRAL
jgi:hypothetical protein